MTKTLRSCDNPTVHTEVITLWERMQMSQIHRQYLFCYPTLDHLRANDNIQKAVTDRLAELQHLNLRDMSQEIKSQRGGQVKVFVKPRAKWPHEYVLAGKNKERFTYNHLTMGQWMDGFSRAVREESNQNSKEEMLDYLISLLDDAYDFSWTSAKASHAELLCLMEHSEIKDYTQTE